MAYITEKEIAKIAKCDRRVVAKMRKAGDIVPDGKSEGTWGKWRYSPAMGIIAKYILFPKEGTSGTDSCAVSPDRCLSVMRFTNMVLDFSGHQTFRDSAGARKALRIAFEDYMELLDYQNRDGIINSMMTLHEILHILGCFGSCLEEQEMLDCIKESVDALKG